jgi:hypothetical protein
MKILFCFDGSDGDSEQNTEHKERLCIDNDVLRIYIKGCINQNVGNGFYFPDLEIIATHIRNAFGKDNYFDLNQLKLSLEEDLYAVIGANHYMKNGIQHRDHAPFVPTEIALEGLSRGGVTTFAVAKKLNELNIPLRVLANQPVPGEIYPYTPIFSKYYDLSACTNIQSATILLAKHIDTLSPLDLAFRQMVCRFPETTDSSIYFLPFQSHSQCQTRAPVSDHLGKALAKWGYLRYPEEIFTQKIHYWYDLKKDDPRYIYNGGEDLYIMKELPDDIEVYNGCHIFLKDNQELYEIRDGKVESRQFGEMTGYSFSQEDYYFTPDEYTQSIFGAESPIAKDPCYIDWLTNRAKGLITEWPELKETDLNEEKAAAIIAISKLNLVDYSWIQSLINDDEKGLKLRKIINKTEEICSFLIDNCDYSSREQVEEHYIGYKQDIYRMSYEFLNGNKFPQHKKQFSEDIYRAEVRFREQALALDSDSLRSALKIITNFITHLTGIGIFINGINKYLTGNWLLFSHSRNENIVRDNRMDILNYCDV